MQICLDHWTALRDKIDAAGLGALVADSQDGLARRLDTQRIEQTTTIDTFEPLWAATSKIMLNARFQYTAFGIPLDNPGCPIEVLNSRHDRACSDCQYVYDEWLDYAVHDALRDWHRITA